MGISLTRLRRYLAFSDIFWTEYWLYFDNLWYFVMALLLPIRSWFNASHYKCWENKDQNNTNHGLFRQLKTVKIVAHCNDRWRLSRDLQSVSHSASQSISQLVEEELRKSWKSHEKVLRKLWESHEKVMRMPWVSHEKVMRNS